MKEHYETLGLDPKIQHDPKDIKKAWKKKCHETHPDHKKGSHDKFLKVTHAYKMITSPEYRINDEKQGVKQVDLNVRLQIPITFLEGVFGKTVVLSYNQNIIDENGSVIPMDEYKIITLTIKVPLGTVSSTEVVFIEKGLRLKDTDTVGNAHAILIPQQHPKFKARGDSIVTEEQIPIDLMLTGGKHEVQTLYGLESIKIPPGTQPGTEFKIVGHGTKQGCGAHIAVIIPVFPTQDDLKQKKVWSKLDIDWKKAGSGEDKDDASTAKFESYFKQHTEKGGQKWQWN